MSFLKMAREICERRSKVKIAPRVQVTRSSPQSLVTPALKSLPKKKSTKSGAALSVDAKKAKSLIPIYLEDAVRVSTKNRYRSYWMRYKCFCQENKLSLQKGESISMFLISLAESTKGNSAPMFARNAIKYNLKLLYPFKKCATDSWFVSRILSSARKKFARPVKKAATLDSASIVALVQHLLSSGDFKDERTAVFILTQFVLFGRFEEISKLKRSNVKILASGDLEVLFEEAKNFNVWDSRSSCIAKNAGDGLDPVSILLSYMDKIKDCVWLFPNFRKGKAGKLIFQEKPVSFDNMLKLLRQGLDGIGMEGKMFTMHSVRTGALSEAANSGVCDREGLKRHVRWSGVGMVDHYHKYSLERRLKPCFALNFYAK